LHKFPNKNSSQFLTLEKAVRFPKFPQYQLLPPTNNQPTGSSRVSCNIKDRCPRIKMWLEQCFLAGDLSKWIKDEILLIVKFVSIIDGSELMFSFNEKDSQVIFMKLLKKDGNLYRINGICRKFDNGFSKLFAC